MTLDRTSGGASDFVAGSKLTGHEGCWVSRFAEGSPSQSTPQALRQKTNSMTSTRQIRPDPATRKVHMAQPRRTVVRRPLWQARAALRDVVPASSRWCAAPRRHRFVGTWTVGEVAAHSLILSR